jgi:hypothetical protein
MAQCDRDVHFVPQADIPTSALKTWERANSVATHSMLSSSDAGFCRVFESLSGLYLRQPWLGQSLKGCTCVACWNVCAARCKGVTRVTELDGDNVDDCLGVSGIYLCSLRNVETSSRELNQPDRKWPPAGSVRCRDEICAQRGQNRRPVLFFVVASP